MGQKQRTINGTEENFTKEKHKQINYILENYKYTGEK